ncbi:signal peptidase II [Qipengyuania marisflavi]|uniref:Lipoprotein signal peptidase n=1 Tax=Qipengyuania marisflavi TaxID=2486356 RepID=A0A5S3P7C7_9SPHN|nr:signal peptidase II [Qipengyuania marisflavi]TMM48133.1 signal peptidase II [Qipengyuania marisflavi]
MKTVTRNRLIGLAAALVIYFIDQWSKNYVTKVLRIDQLGDSLELLPIFNLTFTRNFGVSLGMFEATSPEMRWTLVAVTALIALVVTVWLMREKEFGDIAGLSLILGGALGNIKDRYDLGYVVDFADLHFGEFRPFLIFNIADAAITIGVVIILARAFFMRDKVDELMNSKPADAAENI